MKDIIEILKGFKTLFVSLAIAYGTIFLIWY